MMSAASVARNAHSPLPNSDHHQKFATATTTTTTTAIATAVPRQFLWQHSCLSTTTWSTN